MGGLGYFKMSFRPIVEAFAAIIIRGYNARRDFIPALLRRLRYILNRRRLQ